MSILGISIVTVTFNSAKFLADYFASIKKQNFGDWEAVLVDCGSEDETVKKIKNEKLKMIQREINIGFAKGNNLGARNSNGEYLFFLNPDTKLETGCPKALWDKAQSLEEQDFILIPRQKNYETGEFANDGVCVDIFGYPYKIYNTENPTATKPPFFCDGAALFLPRKTFLKLGMFDEEHFLFNEEIDLCWKAHLLAIPLVNVPWAVVYHYSGGSLRGGIRREKIYKTSYERRYLGERNALRNLIKNYSLPTLLWILPLYLIINLGEILIFFLAGKPKAAFQYLKAWWWNILNIRSTLAKRLIIQKIRKVNDFEILRRLYFSSGKLKAFLSIKVPEFE